MVITGKLNSCIITGSGGVGKSYGLNQKLNEHGLNEGEDYVILKGSSTAKGIFEVIKDNPTKLLILDDIDTALSDTKTANILKAALDTNKKRVVSWVTYEGDRRGNIYWFSSIYF